MSPQYFLPCMTRDNRVIGVLPVPLTTYTGTETSVTVNSVPYRTKRITYKPLTSSNAKSVMDFLAIDISPTEERKQWQGPLRALSTLIGSSAWYLGAEPFKRELVGDLDFFMNGQDKSAALTVVQPPSPTASNVSKDWSCNAPFSNAPSAQFFDLPVGQLANITNPQEVVTINVGTPSADPGAGQHLRAVLVQPTNLASPGASMATIRVIRMTRTGVVPSGTYTWPVTLIDTKQASTTFNVSVVVP